MNGKTNSAQKKIFSTELADFALSANYNTAVKLYRDLLNDPSITDDIIAELGKRDRFFLLTVIMNRKDASHPWLYERCREVEKDPDGYLDLWARNHYKSTIITFAGSIQEIINNPGITIGIFSHTGKIARDFLSQIKEELEKNAYLKLLYPDIFWEAPKSNAPKWSLTNGICVKRNQNPKEQTVEGHGLVDGQPTGKHFDLLIFDDVVTLDSVNTPDQIIKTTDAWELAQNLGSIWNPRTWHIGTRYSYSDTYQTLLDRKALRPRVYAATDDGTISGKPIFLTREVWDKKVADSSLFTIACQQLQNPNEGGGRELEPEWLRTYDLRPETLNVYILCDYAGSRKTTGSSNTAMAVVGVDGSMNKFILDGACHKMDLDERWQMLKGLRKKWIRAKGIQIVKVGYERFGAQSDIEHFEAMMKLEPGTDPFPIEELNWPADGSVQKDNRIRRLVPDLKNWRMFVPYSGEPTSNQRNAFQGGRKHLISSPIKRKDENGKIYDLMEWWIKNEYMFFPNTVMKDFLDALSRIYDIDPQPPIIINESDVLPDYHED